MRRRHLMIAALPTAAMSKDAVWDLPHKDPRTLKESQVDPLMWPICKRINQSGWLWTSESCQGHPGGHPTMLGLVTGDAARMWRALRASDITPRREAEDPRGTAMLVRYFDRPRLPLGDTQVRIILPEGDLPFFGRLSEIV